MVVAALALCAALAAAALAASTNFVEPASSPEAAGDAPFSVAAADLDGDSDRDLAVANADSDNVTILAQQRLGQLQPSRPRAPRRPATPLSVAAADLDGDADQDLAVANDVSDNVTILLNIGAGNFTQPASSPEAAGAGPTSVAAADLDGDADQDLAVANSDLQQRDDPAQQRRGQLRRAGLEPRGGRRQPLSVAAADLDGDADRDLAVANLGSDNVTILTQQRLRQLRPAGLEPRGGRRPAPSRSPPPTSTATPTRTSRSRTAAPTT